MCIFNERLILGVSRWVLRVLCKMHIVKDYDVQHEKLLAMIKQYKEWPFPAEKPCPKKRHVHCRPSPSK